MDKSSNFGLLHKFLYPPYQIVCNNLDTVIVCGGGGGSYRSGIPNRIEIYELSKVKASDKTALPILKNTSSFDTNDKIVMSLSRHFNYLLTAEKADLCEYILTETTHTENKENAVEDKRNDDKIVELKLHRKVVNCFEYNDKDSEITIVRYCGCPGSLVIAGESRGRVKIFQRYSEERPMELVSIKEFADVSDGRNVSIVDLDVSPNGEEFVTICESPDGKYARVWSIARGVKMTELALTSPRTKKLSIKSAYKFKHCRYGSTFLPQEDGKASFLLYTTHQPAKRDPKAPSFMSLWGPADPHSGNDYQLIDVVPLGNNKTPFLSNTVKLVPTALAVSGNGLLSAIGSGEGQVDVYRFDSKSCSVGLVYRLPHAHSFVVTDMAFMPSGRQLSTGHDFELLSVSIDTMLRYHRQPTVRKFLRLEQLSFLLSALVIVFLCDRLSLLLNLF